MKQTILVLALVILTFSCASVNNSPKEPQIQIYGDFEIQIESSENAVTILYYRGSDTDIAIPEKINGIPVTVIGKYAFSRQGNILT